MSNTSAGARVELRSLRKEYADLVAVDDVTLDIAPGEFVTFLGPSGSGKTTTLNMIAGFAQATAGAVIVGGKDVTDVAPHNRQIGMVFQSYALFPNMTVRGNVAFPLQQKRNGVPKAEIADRVEKALAMVDLTHLAHRKPRALSGGQQQRVALARALVFSPSLLLLDEPLAALDKRLRERLQNEMRAIHKDLGVTFILVTHDQTEAMSLSDRIVVFDQGAIQQVGTPEDLYLRPESRFVAEFLGDSNLFDGTVADGGRHVTRPDGSRIDVAPTRIPPGADVLAIVRPEHLEIVVSAEGSAHTNHVRMRVRSAIFEGSHYRVEGETPDGQELLVQHPATGEIAPVEGALVTVAWTGAHTHVFRV